MGKRAGGGGRRVASARATGTSNADPEQRLFAEMQAMAATVANRNQVRPGLPGISRAFKAADLREFAQSEPKIAAVAKEYLGKGRRLFFTTKRGGSQFYQSAGDKITYFIPTGRTYGGRPVYRQSAVTVPNRNVDQTRTSNGIEGLSSPLPAGSYAVRMQTTQYAEMVDITYFR